MQDAVIQFEATTRQESPLETLETFLTFKRAMGLREPTITGYQKTIKAFFRRYPMAWSSPEVMRSAVVEWLSDDISAGFYNLRLIFLRAFWDWCVEEQLQPESPNPFRGFKGKPTPGRFLDIDANRVKALLERPDRSTWVGLRDYTLILFTLDTAVRPNEALHLVLGDFNLTSLCVTIPANIAKTKESRIVPFSEPTRQALNAFLKVRPSEWDNDVPVFASERGTPLGTTSWGQRLKKYRLQDGTIFKTYDLRHASCTLHLRAGMTGEALQRLMGHRGPEMTQRYIHLTTDDLKEQQALTSPVQRLVPMVKKARRKIQ